MITASEFLKWLEVFGVNFGPNTITIPVTMGQGGTGAVLTPAVNSIVMSGASAMELIPPANDSVFVSSPTGEPGWSTTLPAGLTIPDYLALTGGTMTGTLTLAGPPVTDNDAATKIYVDQVAAGLAPAGPVDAATTANFSSTYDNGAAGVGATLTASAPGAVTFDGVSVTLGQDYLFKNQSAPAQNGIYICTTLGDVGTPAVFTRSINYDQPTDINNTGLVPVINGSTQNNTGWYQTNTITTVGTDALNFVRFGNSGTVTSITAGVGLTGGTITGSGTIGLDVPVIPDNGGTGVVAPTAHGLLIGAGSSAMNVVLPSVTAGIPFVSQGSSSDPHYSTASPAGGGTGLTTFAQNALLYAAAANVWAALSSANNSTLVTDGSGVPSYSQTLPNGVQTNITRLGTQAQALNMGSFRITAAADPLASQDVMTLAYAGANYLGINAARITSINFQSWNASNTYTPTPGMLFCIATVNGAGGGGGGVIATGANQNCIASGGGGGGNSMGFFTAADIGVSKTVTVGTGGAGGSTAGGNGGNGGSSSLGTLLEASGGSGGLGNASATGGFMSPGGAGGIATIPGNIGSSYGSYGGVGFGSGGNGVGACGGDSYYGKGGSPTGKGTNTSYASSGEVTTVLLGKQYGGGGAGGISLAAGGSSPGGAGANAQCWVLEFIGV